MAATTPCHSSTERPSALVDYLVVYVRDEHPEARLCRRYPDDDILGAPLPIAELTPYASDSSNLDPAISLTVCDSGGNLFYCTRISIRPEPHRDLEYVLIIVSRRPRFKLFQEALIGIKSLVLSGDCVESQLEQLLFEFPSNLDRLVKTIWDGVGELTVGLPTLRCGLPEVDDYSINILLDSIGAETLTLSVECLLREDNVIFVSQRAQPLAPAIEALKSLLHPMQWMGICVHLVPRDSVHRALSRRGLPFLYGLANFTTQSVRDLLSKHNDIAKCFIVNLDDGKAEWFVPSVGASAASSLISGGVGSSTGASGGGGNSTAVALNSASSSVSLCAELRRMVSEKYRFSGTQRSDAVRLAFLQGLVDMLHGYKQHVNSWSTSSTSKREAGFDCESFLSHTRLEYFDFLKVLLATRAFGDFILRVVNNTSYFSSTFDKFCKAWPQPELPHAARELLMRRYGYTERGARHVWVRVKHLQNDPNLFSSKKFRDFVSELGLSKDGPPSTGDPFLDDIVDRQMRFEALAARESDKACPPLILNTVTRRPKQPGAGGTHPFPPQNLYLTSFNQRLSAWIPRRDDPVLFTRPSAKATYFAFCRHPNDDELLTWKSQSFSRPRLHLAFAGGSNELKTALAASAGISSVSNSSVSSSGTVTLDGVNEKTNNGHSTNGSAAPKPITSLTSAMKWAQLQGKRSLYDANQMLFHLLMEERHRHREEIRRLREKRSSSSVGTGVPITAATTGMPQHFASSSSTSSELQYAGDPEMNHPRGGNSGAYGVDFTVSDTGGATGAGIGGGPPAGLVESLEAKVRLLEEKLKERDLEIESLTRQVRNSEAFSASVVRKSEPLFSPKLERPPSPGAMSVASSNQSSSLFASPISTPRRASLETPNSLGYAHHLHHPNPTMGMGTSAGAPNQVAFSPANNNNSVSSPVPYTPGGIPSTISPSSNIVNLASSTHTSPQHQQQQHLNQQAHHQQQQQRIVSPPPFANNRTLRVSSPTPMLGTPTSSSMTPAKSGGGLSQADLKRSASMNSFEQVSHRASMGSPPPLFGNVSPQPVRSSPFFPIGNTGMGFANASPANSNSSATPLDGGMMRSASGSIAMTMDAEQRRERNQRMLDSIENGWNKKSDANSGSDF